MENDARTSATGSPPLEAAFQDRDLSWLDFNRRVLHEALDDRTPLLERLKFLAIFSSNLDEFFMKRIHLLKRRSQRGVPEDRPGRLAPARTLAGIREKVLPMLGEQAECFRRAAAALRAHGVELLDWSELSESQREEANRFFHSDVFPVLTPLALDPGHPFPFLSNLSTSLGVILVDPEVAVERFARIKIPSVFPGWLRLTPSTPDGGAAAFVRLTDVIRNNLDRVFPGMSIVDTTLFRVTRDAEVELNEDVEDLREQVVEELRQRRFEPVVRLELQERPNPWIRELLTSKFGLGESDVYEREGELEYSGLFAIAGLPRPELRDPPWTPREPAMLPDPDADIFAAIRARDILVHHPYESFDSSVERFIRAAADDPDVRAIKMTVYRVGDDTPFVKSLIRAAESGKQVVCVIEVRARFDEARNLHWAGELERVGAHVVYGVVGLKTHAKLALVVRQEPDGMRSYAHIGTGNYNVKTARLYTDLGLFTSDPAIIEDVVSLFHSLTGLSRKRDYRMLLVAPVSMRTRFLELIEREAAFAREGRPARIVAKMNQLEDPAICRALCRASQDGVPIDLIVRGFSCLKPGVPGLTDEIRIVTVIGRFLEHSRIYHFSNGSDDSLDGLYFLGSADWMNRNLSARVEAITPVESRPLRERLWEILQVSLEDHRQAWDMQPDGSYIQRRPAPDATGPAEVGTQPTLMARTIQRTQASTT